MSKILAIIPSRGRPRKCQKAYDSLEGAERLILVDYDQAESYHEHLAAKIVKRKPMLPMYYNHAALEHEADFYMAAGDDMEMLTPDWTREVFDKMNPDIPQLGWIPDRSAGHPNGLAAYPILTRAWVRATGRIFPEIFPYWFTDRWITEVADALGVKVKLNLEYVDIGEREPTNRMRDLCFWSRVYALTKADRQADVDKLAAVIGIDPPQLSPVGSMTPEHAMALELDYAQWAEEDPAYACVVKNALDIAHRD